MKKERVIIAEFDEYQIGEDNIKYICDCLVSEFPSVLERVIARLDSDDSQQAAMITLYEEEKHEELAAAIKLNKDVATIVEEEARSWTQNDSILFQDYYDRELEMVDEEFEGSPFMGCYRKEGDSDYVHYSKGSDLVRKVISEARDNDFEVWREVNGALSVKCGSYTTFIPIEVDLSHRIGKCVVADGDVHQISRFTGADGSEAEFDAIRYNARKKKFDDDVLNWSERHCAGAGEEKVIFTNLRNALRIVRCENRITKLHELGVI